ncbi:hypothetical protein NMY22_g5536 [Coprinellus aureogranulatus]|nr:hypothetical protein NMY22_g5536 [Coprinellus aureogranulatus]
MVIVSTESQTIPVTPARRTAFPPGSEGLMQAPTKKYPIRVRRTTERAAAFWREHAFNADPANTFSISTSGLEDSYSAQDAHRSGARLEGGNIPLRPRNVSLQRMHETQDQGVPQRANEGHGGSGDLHHKICAANVVIEALKVRVGRLEKNEHRLRTQIASKRELLKDTKAIAEGAQSALVIAEETIASLEAKLANQRLESGRYRRWWLTENRSLHVALQAMPHNHEEFKHIMASCQRRFETYSNDAM